MSCDSAKGSTERISLLIDGELPQAEARELERHLVTCSECHEMREDFLNLRSQISAYNPSLEPAASNRALAHILEKSHARWSGRSSGRFAGNIQPDWRTRFLGALPTPRFGTPMAAFAALLLVAFTIAAIALLSYQRQGGIVTNKSTPQGSEQAGELVATDPESDNNETRRPASGSLRPKGNKNGPREGRRPKQPENRGVKPVPERSAPDRLPRPRNDGAPTYGIASLRPADAETLTAHLEQSELLLRSFRNVRRAGKGSGLEVSHERKRAQQLIYQNIMLRREADAAGDVQVATLLGSLEPILLDIANLRDRPRNEDVGAIKERVERMSLVALLQVNSRAIARALD